MSKQTIINRVKDINKTLLDLGFTEEKIFKFWDECKKEVEYQKPKQLKLNF